MKRETFEEMKKRHEEEIEAMRSRCHHEKWTEWAPFEWAPGHIHGKARVCAMCGKMETWGEFMSVKDL